MFAFRAGRFGASVSLTNASCSGLCSAGFFCVAGSQNSSAAQCGNATVYCPVGSDLPLSVPAGWYSTPDGAAPTATRVGIRICAAGEYCVAGVRELCPGGNFSGSSGQVSCAVCPPGILRNAEAPCEPVIFPHLEACALCGHCVDLRRLCVPCWHRCTVALRSRMRLADGVLP